MILSGWAKADSAWVDRRCTSYNLDINNQQINTDYFHNLITSDNDLYRINRRFEIKAKLTYEHKISENSNEEYEEELYCSFDWMNTNWQYCAFPITIKEEPDYILKSIEVYFDYINNIENAQFMNMMITN